MKKQTYTLTKAQEIEYRNYMLGSAYCFPDERIMPIEEYFEIKKENKNVRFLFNKIGSMIFNS